MPSNADPIYRDVEETTRRMARQCLSSNIRRLERIITRHYDSYVSATGISAVQLPALASVHLNPLLSLREHARLLQIDRTTLWRNLRPLLAARLIREHRDRRPTRYEITRKGLATLVSAARAWDEAHDAIRQALGHQAEKLASTLTGVMKTLDAGP